jgi:hypothetical protein
MRSSALRWLNVASQIWKPSEFLQENVGIRRRSLCHLVVSNGMGADAEHAAYLADVTVGTTGDRLFLTRMRSPV